MPTYHQHNHHVPLLGAELFLFLTLTYTLELSSLKERGLVIRRNRLRAKQWHILDLSQSTVYHLLHAKMKALWAVTCFGNWSIYGNSYKSSQAVGVLHRPSFNHKYRGITLSRFYRPCKRHYQCVMTFSKLQLKGFIKKSYTVHSFEGKLNSLKSLHNSSITLMNAYWFFFFLSDCS